MRRPASGRSSAPRTPGPRSPTRSASLGGEYLEVVVDGEKAEKSSDGYAKATSEAYDQRAAEIYTEQAAEVDIVITTALIPGRSAPRLLTADDVAAMKPGSVIVDMAAGSGGNVEGSKPDEVVVTDNGVTIIGDTDLATKLPTQASQLYGQNLVNLMKLLTPEKDGDLVLDLEDTVQRGMTVAHEGEVLWPPPPVEVSAAPGRRGGEGAGTRTGAEGTPVTGLALRRRSRWASPCCSWRRRSRPPSSP